MSSLREKQRERERNQRQLTIPLLAVTASNGNSSLFGEPIKQKHDDETAKRIKTTLGPFDQVQKFMINDPKPLLGISTREITRIKGSNAKLQHIFSEMKNPLAEPITALDDMDDNDNLMITNGEIVPAMLNNNNATININNNINISNNFYANNANNNYSNTTNLNVQRIIQNNHERNNHSNFINDRSLNDDNDVSDDEHYPKLSSKRRRISSKTDAEIGNKTNANNNTINNNNAKFNNGNIKNSSSSSDSSGGSSSSNSSSSSESSEDDDDEEEEEKVRIEIKKEECPEKDAPKLSSHSQQPEIAEWNLETFMDKTTAKTSTTTPTSVSTTSATVKTNCVDNVADVIDRVANGELGEEYDWSDDSMLSSPKKKRKSLHQETKRKEQSKQESKHDQPSTPSTPQQHLSQHKPAKNQQNNKSSDIQDHIIQQQIHQKMSELNSSQQKLSSSPKVATKSLIVSIKLMLLKRIPGQVYTNNCVSNPSSSSCSSSRSSGSSSNGDAVTAIANDDNIIKPIKTKASQNNNKLEKLKSIKVEDVNNKLPRDLAKSITKSKTSSSKSLSQPPEESRIASSIAHIPSSDHLICDQSLSSAAVKLEPHSPQNSLAAHMTPTQQIITPPFNLPPPPTLIPSTIGQNMNSAINLRTPPEIAGTSLGQAPDDYLSSAKKLKHAADREQDRTAQACKYLEAVLFFILTGNAMEQRSAQNDVDKVCVMYRETLNLLRVCTTKFTKSRSSHQSNVPTTDYKLTTLSFRCQSLLSLKLSRLKTKEIRDNNKLIQQQTQELALNGSAAASLVSVMQKQLALLQQYHNAHDTWQQADHLIEKHLSCKAFVDALDNECGPLSLNSNFDHLVHYVKTGLQILK